MRRFGISLLLAFFIVVPAWAVPLTIQTAGGNIVFDVDVADTPKKKERGLMFVTSMLDNRGMIFINNREQEMAMWMKNTYIPLDIVYYTRDGRITKIISNTKPHDLTPLPSDIPVAGAIELNGGITTEKGIMVGDKIIFRQ